MISQFGSATSGKYGKFARLLLLFFPAIDFLEILTLPYDFLFNQYVNGSTEKMYNTYMLSMNKAGKILI